SYNQSFSKIQRSRVFISYRHNPDLDELVALQIYETLSKHHEVFIDRRMLIGTDWAKRIEIEISKADYLIAILSAYSVRSEMFVGEIELAYRLAKERGTGPLILPIRLAYNKPLHYPLSAYLSRYNWLNWECSQDTPRLINELMTVISGGEIPLSQQPQK